jgi:GTP-binding protein
MFVDQAKIYVKAGDGGKGCRSFYRDKYNRVGTPDGGDGGRGTDIIIRADRNLKTLLDFRYRREFRGQHGGHGSGKNKKGKNAPALVIRVPVGTTIKDAVTGCVLRDLAQDADELLVAKGGRPGQGNWHGREVTEGAPGEERKIVLDLRLIADVGVIGFPNAGKSTLISAVSGARPQIAAYPFTTKAPVLGRVDSRDKSFVIADIPGLIEGSSAGKGLGDRFLRHIERTRVIVHLIDMAACDGRDPLHDYHAINQELKNYGEELGQKPQVLAANKVDLKESEENLTRFKQSIKKKIYPVSALKKYGLEELVEAISKKL